MPLTFKIILGLYLLALMLVATTCLYYLWRNMRYTEYKRGIALLVIGIPVFVFLFGVPIAHLIMS